MRRLTLFAAVLLCLAPGLGQAWELGARGAYWIADLSGTARLDSATVGTEVNFRDDLGVDNENFFFGEAWFWAGRHHLTLSGTRIDYSGSARVDREIRFGGTTFALNARVDTSLEYTMLDLVYQYDLLDLENVLAGFSLGPLLQIKYLDGSVSLDSTGQREEESFRVPIPLVGLGGHLGLVADLLEVRARAAGIAYSGNHLVEAQAELSLNPMPFFEIVGGYRYFSVKVEEGDLFLDYTQGGPYVGASLKI